MNRRDSFEKVRVLVAAALILGSLGACTSSGSGGASPAASVNSSSPGGGDTSTTPSAPAAELVECTKSSIKDALPKASDLVKFDCAIASPAMWAAARVTAGSVFFLTSLSGPWKVTPGNALCGAKIKQVPKALRGYCG